MARLVTVLGSLIKALKEGIYLGALRLYCHLKAIHFRVYILHFRLFPNFIDCATV